MTQSTGRVPMNRDEFTRWVRPHVAALTRIASRIAPFSDRDDIVQTALARAWQKRGQFDPARGAPQAWLLTITANEARDSVRQWRPAAELVDHAASDHDSRPCTCRGGYRSRCRRALLRRERDRDRHRVLPSHPNPGLTAAPCTHLPD